MEPFEFGDFRVYPRTGELRKAGVLVPLQGQPFKILLVLAENAEKLVSREDLRGRLWPPGIHQNFDQGLNRSVNKLREALSDSAEMPRFIETLPGRGYRFLVQPHALSPATSLTPPGWISTNMRAALSPTCPYYVRRLSDQIVEHALDNGESVVLLTGASQTGKTSLLARALNYGRSTRSTIITTDISKFNAMYLSSANEFLFALADDMGQQCATRVGPEQVWSERRAPNLNFDRYVKALLRSLDMRVLWAVDEMDRLFGTSFAGEFFALVRSWHNERALRPESPVNCLTVLLSYSRETPISIINENQSPFNVGTKVTLKDFGIQETLKLNEKYGTPMTKEEVARLHAATGGHPLLTTIGIQAIITGEFTLDTLLQRASYHDGVFGEHLLRLLRALKQNPALLDPLRTVIARRPLTANRTYELHALGILSHAPEDSPRLRCSTYEQFLMRELM